MKRAGVRMIGWGIFGLLVTLAVYVRIAPSDVGRWHVAVEGEADRDMAGGAVRVVEGGAEVLTQIDAAMRGLARTSVLAGSMAEGRVTYVTRSAVVGFPDYTTVELRGDKVAVFGRLRFGKSDLGVNKARLEEVLGR